MKIKWIFPVFISLITSTLFSQAELPLHHSNLPVKSLSELSDASLQNSLELELRANPEWRKLIDSKKMAVGIIDLSNPDNGKFACVNGDDMMYAASLPKIAILLAAMDAIEKGELKETAAVKYDMRIMISKSDNDAATRMIDRVGYRKIEKVMTDPRYNLYDKATGGGLWVGKRYGSGGDTNREPLKKLSHAATVSQVCKYYYLLANGQLVSEKRSKQMLGILENPELHHKFVNTLEKISPLTRLFRKSGSWQTYHSDSVLVWDNDPNRRYILVALIDSSNGEQIIRDLVKPVEKVLKASNYKLAQVGT